MNIKDSVSILKEMLNKYPVEGNGLFFPKREALKTAIRVMEKSTKK